MPKSIRFKKQKSIMMEKVRWVQGIKSTIMETSNFMIYLYEVILQRTLHHNFMVMVQRLQIMAILLITLHY